MPEDRMADDLGLSLLGALFPERVAGHRLLHVPIEFYMKLVATDDITPVDVRSRVNPGR
jgi:hypothetical protein